VTNKEKFANDLKFGDLPYAGKKDGWLMKKLEEG